MGERCSERGELDGADTPLELGLELRQDATLVLGESAPSRREGDPLGSDALDRLVVEADAVMDVSGPAAVLLDQLEERTWLRQAPVVSW